MKIEYDETGCNIKIYDYQEVELYKPTLKAVDIEDNLFSNLCNVFDFDINVFMPINEGNDFVIKNIGNGFLDLIGLGLKNKEDLIGRIYGDVFPLFKEAIYGFLKQVYETKEIKVIKLSYYQNGELIRYFEGKCVFEDNDIYLPFEDKTDIFNLKNNLNIIESISKTAIFHDTPNGFIWSHGFYDIIERKMEASDSNNNILADLIIGEDKEFFEKQNNYLSPKNSQVNFEARILTENNNLKYLNCLIKAIFNKNGEVTTKVGFCQDITDKKILEEENIKINEVLDEIGPNLKVAILIQNPNGDFIVSDKFYDIFGIEKGNIGLNMDLLSKNISNSEIFFNAFSKLKNNEAEEVNEIFEYDFPESEITKTLSLYVKHYRTGKKNYLIGYIQDITDSIKKQKELKRVIDEKTILIEEVHHRVKNNLQILNSFLNLEERFNKDMPEKVIQDTRSYIGSLALIHEKAYYSDNIGFINVKNFIDDINTKLVDLFSHVDIEFITSIQDNVYLLIDLLTPLTLIINELTTNSIKHAFPQDKKDKKIYNSFCINEEGICEFIYKDNGLGLPEDENIDDIKSLGWTIIKSLSSQLNGTFSEIEAEGMGFKLEFPVDKKEMYIGASLW